MVNEAVNEICNVKKICDVIYATTRTVSFASQVVLEHIGFVSLGIFPNVRKVQTHETHGLEVYYSKSAFQNRAPAPMLILEFKKIYKIAQDIFKFENATFVDKIEEVPEEKSIWFIYEDDVKKVEEAYEKCRRNGETISGFFPFHAPNMRFYSEDHKNEIYCNINRCDGHMVIIGFKCQARNFTNLLNSFCRAAQAVTGAKYVELLVSAFEPLVQKQALEARFLPCAYVPAFALNDDGKRIDYLVMSRSFVNLDFTELHLVKNNQKFLEAFMECWYNLQIKLNKASEDETNIFSDG
jgi:hypothetical protein